MFFRNQAGRVFVTCVVIIVLTSANASLAVSPELCLQATQWREGHGWREPVGGTHVREIRNLPGQSHTLFELAVEAPGVLHLEIFPPPIGPTSPRVEFYDSSCMKAGEGLTFGQLTEIEAGAGRYIAQVREPGDYFVAVYTPAEMPGDFYRLISRFSIGEDLPRLNLDSTKESCDDSGDDEILVPRSCAPAKLLTMPAFWLSWGEQVTLTVRRPGVLEIVDFGLLMVVERGTHHMGFSTLDDARVHPSEAFRFYPVFGAVEDPKNERVGSR